MTTAPLYCCQDDDRTFNLLRYSWCGESHKHEIRTARTGSCAGHRTVHRLNDTRYTTQGTVNRGEGPGVLRKFPVFFAHFWEHYSRVRLERLIAALMGFASGPHNFWTFDTRPGPVGSNVKREVLGAKQRTSRTRPGRWWRACQLNVKRTSSWGVACLRPATSRRFSCPTSNARTTFHGRVLIVDRYREAGRRPTSRRRWAFPQCVRRWITRYETAGEAGLHDRSPRPDSMPACTSAETREKVVDLCQREWRGQNWIGPGLGLAFRTVGGILRRHQMPYLSEGGPMTGKPSRRRRPPRCATNATGPANWCTCTPVKLTWIADGGEWRGLAAAPAPPVTAPRVSASTRPPPGRWTTPAVVPDENGLRAPASSPVQSISSGHTRWTGSTGR